MTNRCRIYPPETAAATTNIHLGLSENLDGPGLPHASKYLLSFLCSLRAGFDRIPDLGRERLSTSPGYHVSIISCRLIVFNIQSSDG